MKGRWLYGVDIFDETDHFQVVVDLPGVQKDDFSVEMQSTTLDIMAHSGAKRYHRHIDLGIPVRCEPVINGNNGIFEIILGKG